MRVTTQTERDAINTYVKEFRAIAAARPIPVPTPAEREAIAKLALGDMDGFVARAADGGFPFEPEALDALARLIEPYERLRARLKAETPVRVTELEKCLRARRKGGG